MIDVSTHKPLYASTEGTMGPYIMVPVSQLSALEKLLKSRKIPYDIEEDAISLNGKPEVAVVNLGRGADAAAVQSILDSSR